MSREDIGREVRVRCDHAGAAIRLGGQTHSELSRPIGGRRDADGGDVPHAGRVDAIFTSDERVDPHQPRGQALIARQAAVHVVARVDALEAYLDRLVIGEVDESQHPLLLLLVGILVAKGLPRQADVQLESDFEPKFGGVAHGLVDLGMVVWINNLNPAA